MKRQTKIICLCVTLVLLTALLLSKIFFPIVLWVPAMKVSSFFTGWGPISWKEEVLLHDGSTVVIKRSQSHGGRGEIGQSPIKLQSISFIIPGTSKRVIWKDKATPDIGIANFDTVALHILNETPYLILHPDKCLSFNKWGRPNPPYILYKHEGTGWQQIQMADLPTEFENVNLTITTSGDEKKLVSKWVVPHEMVTELNSSLTQEYYHKILREPLEPGSPWMSCEELKWYKCGWGAPGEFNKEYFESLCP